MDPVPPELNVIFREIDKALDAKLYYLGNSAPDICACLEFNPDSPPRANADTLCRVV